MHKRSLLWLGCLWILLLLWGSSEQDAYGQERPPAADYTQFLPAILLNYQEGMTIPRTPTPVTTPVTTPTTPSASPTPTATATATPQPNATATTTATPTPTLTTTPTSAAPTPTPTATVLAFPNVTFSCRAEPATGNALVMVINAQLDSPAPYAASFKLDLTSQSGPINTILQPLPFQLINIFMGDTSVDATGFLTRCDQANQCTATYTVTETDVDGYIGTAVDCTY